MPLTPTASGRFARPAGFTLVELLTVIAIIGILAAIIVPVVGKVRASARTSACASNLRQIAAGCLLYANENKGMLVPIREATASDSAVGRKTWRILIEPYIGSRRDGNSVLICPDDSVTDYPVSSGTGEWPNSYGLNSASQYMSGGTLLEYNPGSKSQSLLNINRPGRFIMATDIGRSLGGGGSNPAQWTEDRGTSSVSFGYARFPWNGSFSLEWGVWGRHAGGTKANAAFYDGHVELLDVVADLQQHPNGDPLCLFDNH